MVRRRILETRIVAVPDMKNRPKRTEKNAGGENCRGTPRPAGAKKDGEEIVVQ